jgi:hypothetical protein
MKLRGTLSPVFTKFLITKARKSMMVRFDGPLARIVRAVGRGIVKLVTLDWYPDYIPRGGRLELREWSVDCPHCNITQTATREVNEDSDGDYVRYCNNFNCRQPYLLRMNKGKLWQVCKVGADRERNYYTDD